MFSHSDDCFLLKDCDKCSFSVSPVPETQWLLAPFPLRDSSQWQHRKEHSQQLPWNAQLHGEVQSEGGGWCTVLTEDWVRLSSFVLAHHRNQTTIHAYLDFFCGVWKMTLHYHSMVKSIARPHTAQENNSVVLLARFLYWHLYNSSWFCCVYKSIFLKKRIFCILVYVSLVCISPEDLASSRCFMPMGPYAYTGKNHGPLWTKFFSELLYCHLEIPLFSLLLCIKDYVNQEAETLLVRLIPPQCITS